MPDVLTFTPKKETVIIKDREYALAPRNKILVEKLEQLKKRFKKPDISFDDLLTAFHESIDMLLGDGSFISIFGVEDKADIDEIAALYAFIIGKYNSMNNATIVKSAKPKKK